MLTVTTVFLIPAAFLNHWTQSYLSGLGSIAIGLLLTGVADVLIDKVGVRKNNAFLKQGKGEESSLFQQTEAKAQRSVSWDSLQLVMPKVSRTESGDDSLWLSVKKAALVGIFQLISLIPGLSRSGMTTLGGLFVGFRRDLAVKYAFLSAIPVLVAKILMQSVTVMQDGIRADWLPYLLGMAAAFVSGVFSIALMRKVVRKYRCKRFGIYCFVIGIIILMIRLRG